MTLSPDFFLGVDTGGTFTDFVLLEPGKGQIRTHKVLSTPHAPEEAVLQGINELGLRQVCNNGQLVIIHGSTVATNAALEGKGVKTVYITNKGFGDTLSIGRQTRTELYNLQPPPKPVIVEPQLCLEADCRISARGETLTPLTTRDLEHIRQQLQELKPEAVAINFLFSFLDDSSEKAVEAIIPDTVFVSRSSYVLPEYKEYERGIATWLNAYLGPLVQHYLARLQKQTSPSPLGIMQSSGGTIDAQQAGRRAVNLLLSGPAGGLSAARFIGRACHTEQLMTFDMGGTSTDVALIDGELRLTNEGHLGPYPVAVPMVDMHTIGAGGGSIAFLDEGGLLQVGPKSAGASPGPACYGKGGTSPTVTDANAVLGRLQPDNFLGGNMSLDLNAATKAVAALAEQLNMTTEQTAQGIIDIANEHMIRALRVISVQRGHDPKAFSLCSFGGAGGLHVCALADALNLSKAIVPVYGGVLSALGMLVASKERQLSCTFMKLLDAVNKADLFAQLKKLGQQGVEQLLEEGARSDQIQQFSSVDLRYQGQSYTLNIPLNDMKSLETQFHQLHSKRYGHSLDIPIELVNLRQQVVAFAEPVQLPEIPAETQIQPGNPDTTATLAGFGATPVFQREKLPANTQITGPALICEKVSTTLIEKNWQACVDLYGNLILSKVS